MSVHNGRAYGSHFRVVSLAARCLAQSPTYAWDHADARLRAWIAHRSNRSELPQARNRQEGAKLYVSTGPPSATATGTGVPLHLERQE